MSWTWRALVRNEFHAEVFNDAAPISGEHAGDYLMGQFEIPTDIVLTFLTGPYLIILYFAFLALPCYTLTYWRRDGATGTRRESGGGPLISAAGFVSLLSQREDSTADKPGVGSLSLGFEPILYAWDTIEYTVPIKVDVSWIACGASQARRRWGLTFVCRLAALALG